MTPCAELSSGRGTRSATQYRRPAEGRATLWPGASARREGRDGAEGDDDREGQRRGGQGLQPPAPVTDPFVAAAPRDEPPAGRDDGTRERDATLRTMSRSTAVARTRSTSRPAARPPARIVAAMATARSDS